MNKKIFVFYKIIVIFFLFGLQNIVAQKVYGKVFYKKRSIHKVKNTTDKNTTFTKEAARKMLKSTYKKMEELTYLLEFNNTTSIFKEIPKMDIDEDKSSIATTLSKLMGGTEGIFFTNKKKNKTYSQKEFESELFLIEISKNNKWQLTQETKKIGKYTCYKAIKKDTYINSSGNLKSFTVVAWYVLEIPYSFGPTKYNGLPGLILELKNNQVILYANKILLSSTKNKEIEKPKKGIEITQKKYDSIKRGLATDFRKKYKRN